MELRCESCGASNPASNRYCGQCGWRLAPASSDLPEEFWRDSSSSVAPAASHLEAEADLPREVVEFDKQIPLIAEDGSDRRIHRPAELIEKAHESLEREAELHDQLHHREETHWEAQARQQAYESQTSFTPASAPEERSAAPTGPAMLQTAPPSAEEQASAAQQDFLSWEMRRHDAGEAPAPPEQAATSSGRDTNANTASSPDAYFSPPHGPRTGISGPSFLGLTDDQPFEYETETPQSHMRRNIAIAILAAVAVLAALQWRSIRDYGVAYVRDGTMRLTPEPKAAPTAPPAVAADNTQRDLGLPPAPANSSVKPVESSPNAGHQLPVQQARAPEHDATQGANTESAPTAAESADKTANPANTHSAANPPPAMAAPAGTATTERAGAPETKQHLRSTREAATPARSEPGADEMRHAAHASDAEARAAWLWRAVGKGNPQAPVELATMYERGAGVVRSCDQARLLLRSAAAKGNPQAQASLQQLQATGCVGR